MSERVGEIESCGPQLIEVEIPSRSWGLDRLGAAAVEIYQRLLKDERFLTPYYWRLGRLLGLARQEFHRGQWGSYLKELGIEKTRASKAMRIYETFANEQATSTMTVAEAYGCRKRKPRGISAKSKRRAEAEAAKEPIQAQRAPSWSQFAQTIVDAVERQLEDAEFWTSGEIIAALAEVERAAALLRQLQERLQRHDARFIVQK